MNGAGGSAAAIFLVFAAAQAAPGESLSADILVCSTQPDGQAQLACYNRIAARLKAGASVAPKAPPDAAHTDFGGDSIPFQAGGNKPADQIRAGVAKVAFNFFHRFTVVLDNGQIWRQDDSDTTIARFDTSKPEVVIIKAGFLGSFHLTIQGEWGSFSVKRIK